MLIEELLRDPWWDARNAASLVVDLVRLVVPPAPKPVAVVQDGDPYRTPAAIMLHDPDLPQRTALEDAVALVERFAQGAYIRPTDKEKTSLYWEVNTLTVGLIIYTKRDDQTGVFAKLFTSVFVSLWLLALGAAVHAFQ